MSDQREAVPEPRCAICRKPPQERDRWVSQTRFGGTGHPPEEQGNCLQAAVASLLAVPLEEAFDAVAAYTAQDGGERHWYIAFEIWARERGLFLWWQDHAFAGMLGIADVRSPDLPGDLHSVITRGRDIVWDPSPRYRERRVEHTFAEQPCFMYLLPLDIGALFQRATAWAPPTSPTRTT